MSPTGGRAAGEVGADAERGAVTAELAVGLPAVVLALLLVLGVAAAGVGQLRCGQGARVGARVATLGEDDEAVRAAVRRVVGDEASITIDRDGSWVTVRVSTGLPVPVLDAAVTLDGAATGWREP
ncbi:TadE family type IV pilus minor pilin [Cellulomonas composti]|uniref:Pilus assembly protein TadE n=1 Tax=Cellulomonas composti TaxID=266130 RepID=A0A511JCR5_9CELL|nr:TadE family type IV pilus minor pilin [Cellulomonas composti]GEL95791.1 hypothetical protein CCO02nite_24490 [Cellulomonas composti]